MRLNVGCGEDVRPGWVNLDHLSYAPDRHRDDVEEGTALDLSRWKGQCEVVLLNHVLHLFDYDEADWVLAECVAALAPMGRLIVVEPDVLRVVRLVVAHDGPTLAMLDRVVPGEATCDGQVLRWIVWHGTRRSVWSPISLSDRLERLGVVPFAYIIDLAHVVDRLLEDVPFGRVDESFVVVGVAP